jgi:hypothetical protein
LYRFLLLIITICNDIVEQLYVATWHNSKISKNLKIGTSQERQWIQMELSVKGGIWENEKARLKRSYIGSHMEPVLKMI